MYIIYQITNTFNNKQYIGLTKSNIARRWYQHRWDAHHRSNKCHFHRAIRKYDPSVWEVTTVCSCRNAEDAEHMERHFIHENDTYKHGYNMTEGGSAFKGLHGEYNGMFGRTHTPEVKQKLAKSATDRFKHKSYEDLYGTEKAVQLKQQRSNDMKQIRADQDLTGTNNPNAKPVIIKGIQFSTSSDAAIHFNKSRPTISQWIRKYDDCYFVQGIGYVSIR